MSVGPGRGSAAGSVVAYCLRITDVDPDFFEWIESKGKGVEFAFEMLFTAGFAMLFAYLFIVC